MAEGHADLLNHLLDLHLEPGHLCMIVHALHFFLQ